MEILMESKFNVKLHCGFTKLVWGKKREDAL